MTAMMAAMRSAPGVVAARQAGAGFGGCMVALVAEEAVEEFAGHVVQDYAARTGLQPAVYPVKAAPGRGFCSDLLAHDLPYGSGVLGARRRFPYRRSAPTGSVHGTGELPSTVSPGARRDRYGNRTCAS